VEKFDIVIVGGGVIGASIAFELAAENLRVLVLDREQPGRQASWAAAGMLSPAPASPRDFPLTPLSKESLRLYPEFIAAIEEASGSRVACASTGTLEIFRGPENKIERDRLLDQYRQLGLAAEPVSAEDAHRLEPALALDESSGPRSFAWLPAECAIDPRLLMDALLIAARARGVEIRPGCEVTQLIEENDRCVGVAMGAEKISAPQVILAAGCFSAQIGDSACRKRINLARYAPTNPVRGQLVALRCEGLHLRRTLRSRHHYLVPREDGRIIAGSTIEHVGFENRATLRGIRHAIQGALEICPRLEDAEILETWAGLRPGTPDDLPILGPTDIDGLLIATGHYRNGILLSVITAKLMREWVIEGRTSFSAEPFSPMRFANRTAAAKS
jgi:glycine oxidase